MKLHKLIGTTVKLGFKEQLKKKQLGNSEAFGHFASKIVNNLAMVDDFATTKKFLITKFNCTKGVTK